MDMKVLHNIMTIVFVGFTIVACGNQTEQKSTRVASSEIETEETEVSLQPDEQIRIAKKLINSTDASKVKAVDAIKMFKNYCALCHGRKGNMEINGAKKLSESNSSLEQRVAQIYFGKGTMMSYKGIIKDEEIIAVARYLDELKK